MYLNNHELTICAADQAFIGSLSFYHFNMILSGACTACTCLLIFSLMAEHARRLSNPSEQIKYVYEPT